MPWISALWISAALGFGAPAAVAKADPPTLPARVGPYWFGDDTARVRPSIVHHSTPQWEWREGTGSDRVGVTLRAVLRARLLHDRVRATLQLEAAPNDEQLVDAWVEGRAGDMLTLRVGQQRIPFTRYTQRALIELPLDWPLAARWFGGERQIGLTVSGQHTPSGMRYALGVYTGQNRRSAFARELARRTGPAPNPSRFRSPSANEPPHAELAGLFAQRFRLGRWEGELALSGTWDTAPVVTRDFALRLAPELRLEHGPTSVRAVGYVGAIEAPNTAIELAAVGVLAELSVRAHRHLELVARLSRVHILPALRSTGAADSAQQETSIAVMIPVLGPSLRLAADLSWLRSERGSTSQDGLRVRMQTQMSF